MRRIDQPRLPRREELVNAFEFEEAARLVLPPSTFAAIAGSDRAAFDRMTFRPRALVPTLDMDLGVDLFGIHLFTPLIVGPVADQRQFHPDGELATVRGATAARAPVIVSSESSVPIERLTSTANTVWFAAYADGSARRSIDQAVSAGCRVVCATVGAMRRSNQRAEAARVDWKSVESLRRGLSVPFVVKGVMTVEEAKAAIESGARGVIVSDHGGAAARAHAPIGAVAAIADACTGRAAVLVDGSFRRGSDIVKALALGARGVLLARPVMWGLAAYGADGVQAVIEMLQSDVGRTMGALGASNVASLTRGMVRVHSR